MSKLWTNINSVLMFKSSKFKFNSNIAFFNFDFTLIKPKNNTWYKDGYDWKLWDKSIISSLQLINKKNGSIIIISNFHKGNVDFLKQRVESFQKKIKLPILAIFSLKKNCFQKPFTRLIDIIIFMYKKEKKQFNLAQSIYIGNNAGRFRTFYCKKDFNLSDRALAYNLNVKFSTPEPFFCKYKNIGYWNWSKNTAYTKKELELILLKMNKQKELDIIKILTNIHNSNIYFILLSGPPCSGKTLLAKKINFLWDNNKISENSKLQIINTNDYSSIKKCSKFIIENINNKKSILLDGRHPDEKIKNKILDICYKYDIPCLFIEIDITIKLCKLLNYVRIQTSKNINELLVPNITFSVYKRNYVNPEITIKKFLEKNEDFNLVKYIKYPLKILNRKELWYKYT